MDNYLRLGDLDLIVRLEAENRALKRKNRQKANKLRKARRKLKAIKAEIDELGSIGVGNPESRALGRIYATLKGRNQTKKPGVPRPSPPPR